MRLWRPANRRRRPVFEEQQPPPPNLLEQGLRHTAPQLEGSIARQLSDNSNDAALPHQLQLLDVKRAKSEQYRAAEDHISILDKDMEAFLASCAATADLEVCSDSEPGKGAVAAHAAVLAVRSSHLADAIATLPATASGNAKKRLVLPVTYAAIEELVDKSYRALPARLRPLPQTLQATRRPIAVEHFYEELDSDLDDDGLDVALADILGQRQAAAAGQRSVPPPPPLVTPPLATPSLAPPPPPPPPGTTLAPPPLPPTWLAEVATRPLSDDLLQLRSVAQGVPTSVPLPPPDVCLVAAPPEKEEEEAAAEGTTRETAEAHHLPAHSAVLIARSSFFRALLSSQVMSPRRSNTCYNSAATMPLYAVAFRAHPPPRSGRRVM